MIKIDADNVFSDDDFTTTMLIVQAPTGIRYEVQMAGLACDHRAVEGFVLTLGQYAQDFDDCGYGCAFIRDSAQEKLADALDAYFSRVSPANPNISFRIDRDRLSELEEGWWPVIVSGSRIGYVASDEPLPDWRGYLHTGNCD